MAKTNSKLAARLRRKKHIRKSVRGTTERPRVSVYRSAKHIYAQIIDDSTGRTLASASSLKLDESGGNRDGARSVGEQLAEAAKGQNITTVVLDRNGFLYHGRVAALADAMREGGLVF